MKVLSRHIFIQNIGYSSSAFLVLWLSISLLTGCSAKTGVSGGNEAEGGFFSWFHLGGRAEQQVEEGDEKRLVRDAMHYYSRGRFLIAEEKFQKIRDRYPFSAYATLSELRLADCKFHMKEYEAAISLYEEFEKLHPTNKAVPYAIFQIGTCYYKLIDAPDRDQTYTHKLIETNERLLKRYPETAFTYEARKRIREARERLAEHELTVARWYLRTNQTLQARNRLMRVLDLYPQTDAGKKAETMLKPLAGIEAAETTESGERRGWRRFIPFL